MVKWSSGMIPRKWTEWRLQESWNASWRVCSHPSFFKYISGYDICIISPTIDEIPDANVQTILIEVNCQFSKLVLYCIHLQLSEASEDSKVRRIAMEDSGISRALALLKK